MKKTIDIILRYLNHDDEEILSLRDSILELDVSRPDEIENALEHILNAIVQVNFDNQDYLGYYHFFLDCLYYLSLEFVGH